MNPIRPPAVAGSFYADDPAHLTKNVQDYLDGVTHVPAPPPKAIIAPHAGYIYSGPTAACAYATLSPLKSKIKRVVLLGPCHRVPVQGFALCQAQSYATPLGNVELDHSLDAELLGLGAGVQVMEDAHGPEHSLEVHLPFLQVVLGDFQLLPIVVGAATPSQVATVLAKLWGGAETLIVISSDLSHDLDYASAQASDQRTCQAIEALDGDAIESPQACGSHPIKGLLDIAKHKGLTVKTLDLRNSGDTAGDKDRVVGYGAWGFWESETPISTGFAEKTRALLKAHGDLVLSLAKGSIHYTLENGDPAQVKLSNLPLDLQDLGASFVTLRKNKQLRGCIGSPEAWRPLGTDVVANANRAAFHDPRFGPLEKTETAALDIHISILSPAEPFIFKDQADFMAKLTPNVDGLVIEDLGQRALFLPSVWEQLPEAEQFVIHLKDKAGLDANHWSTTFKAWRFIAASTGADWDDVSFPK